MHYAPTLQRILTQIAQDHADTCGIVLPFIGEFTMQTKSAFVYCCNTEWQTARVIDGFHLFKAGGAWIPITYKSDLSKQWINAVVSSGFRQGVLNSMIQKHVASLAEDYGHVLADEYAMMSE